MKTPPERDDGNEKGSGSGCGVCPPAPLWRRAGAISPISATDNPPGSTMPTVGGPVLEFPVLDVPMPQIVIEDVRPSDLESRHVFPNIGDMEVHGIWFPQGYDKS